jgi:hypothetical protein
MDYDRAKEIIDCNRVFSKSEILRMLFPESLDRIKLYKTVMVEDQLIMYVNNLNSNVHIAFSVDGGWELTRYIENIGSEYINRLSDLSLIEAEIKEDILNELEEG